MQELIEPDMQISRIRLSDKTSRLHPWHVVPKPAQAHEPEVPVKVREWISSALASPGPNGRDSRTPEAKQIQQPRHVTPTLKRSFTSRGHGDACAPERATDPHNRADANAMTRCNLAHALSPARSP
jgi:hypothetical protein